MFSTLILAKFVAPSSLLGKVNADTLIAMPAEQSAS